MGLGMTAVYPGLWVGSVRKLIAFCLVITSWRRPLQTATWVAKGTLPGGMRPTSSTRRPDSCTPDTFSIGVAGGCTFPLLPPPDDDADAGAAAVAVAFAFAAFLCEEPLRRGSPVGRVGVPFDVLPAVEPPPAPAAAAPAAPPAPPALVFSCGDRIARDDRRRSCASNSSGMTARNRATLDKSNKERV